MVNPPGGGGGGGPGAPLPPGLQDQIDDLFDQLGAPTLCIDVVPGDLGWYLDISEWAYDAMEGPVLSWHGASSGESANISVMPTNQFSVPIPLDAKDRITVKDFWKAVRDALYCIPDRSHGGSDRTYEVSAKVHRFTNKQIGIKYIIECTNDGGEGYYNTVPGAPGYWPADKFSIHFITGPHGAQGDMAPPEAQLSADVEVTNYSLPLVGTFPSNAAVTVLQDKPPVPPGVEFIPYRGVNNKIMLLISGQTGVLRERPILIEPADESKFLSLYVSQYGTHNLTSAGVNDWTSKIEFRSDDPETVYQIFRTELPPESYSDFKGYMLAEYTEYIDADNALPATLATYMDDTILPNTKYYYCFRSIDIHGNISNPTPIFEFQMVDNNGQIYPVVNIHQRCGDSEEGFTKAGRRFIYIAPSTRQIILNPNVDPTSATYNANLDMSAIMPGTAPYDNILGAPGTDQVWDKNFKVRLTSKKTGRKLDLNLTFKNSGVIDP